MDQQTKNKLIYVYKYLQDFIYMTCYKHKKINKDELLILCDYLKGIINDVG